MVLRKIIRKSIENAVVNIAAGEDAMATGDNSNALGNDSLALRDNSSATFGGSTALGYKAEALNDSGTALGAYSNATEISVVSVGNNKGIIPETRKIVNVIDPQNPQDAATKNYADT